MEYTINKHPVYFVNLRNIEENGFMYYLTKIIFYESPEYFNFHYNKHDNERSLLISEDGFSIIKPMLDNHFIPYTKQYYCACITNTYEYLDDTGLVQKISTMFSKENIPILYITTYNNNFVLFSLEYYNDAIRILDKICK